MAEALVNDFSAFDGCDFFDLETYRELGLDLTILEDSSSNAVMPRLRIAAEHFVEAEAATDKPIKYKDPVTQELRNADKQVGQEIHIAHVGLLRRLGKIDIEHEAIQAHADRNPLSHAKLKKMFQGIGRVELLYGRPIDPVTDPEWLQGLAQDQGRSFTYITSAVSVPFMPEMHAAELTQARIATNTDQRRYNLN